MQDSDPERPLSPAPDPQTPWLETTRARSLPLPAPVWLLCLEANVSESLRGRVHVRCKDRYNRRVYRAVAAACRCARPRLTRMAGHEVRGRGRPDPAVNSAGPAIHTYRLPNAPLSSRLMQGGVKHLVMLNLSRGKRMLEPSRVTAHGPREGAGDREDTPDRPRGRGGGRDGAGGRGKGYKWGSSWFWSARKTTTIKNSSRPQSEHRCPVLVIS